MTNSVFGRTHSSRKSIRCCLLFYMFSSFIKCIFQHQNSACSSVHNHSSPLALFFPSFLPSFLPLSHFHYIVHSFYVQMHTHNTKMLPPSQKLFQTHYHPTNKHVLAHSVNHNFCFSTFKISIFVTEQRQPINTLFFPFSPSYLPNTL